MKLPWTALDSLKWQLAHLAPPEQQLIALIWPASLLPLTLAAISAGLGLLWPEDLSAVGARALTLTGLALACTAAAALAARKQQRRLSARRAQDAALHYQQQCRTRTHHAAFFSWAGGLALDLTLGGGGHANFMFMTALALPLYSAVLTPALAVALYALSQTPPRPPQRRETRRLSPDLRPTT